MGTKTVRISKKYLDIVKLWSDHFSISESQVVRMFIHMGLLYLDKGMEQGLATPKMEAFTENKSLLEELFTMPTPHNSTEDREMLAILAQMNREEA